MSRIPALAVFLLPLSSCALIGLPPKEVAETPGSKFAQLVDAYFEARFAFRPTEGTAAGLHQYDFALEELARGRILVRIKEVTSFLERLQAMRGPGLSFEEELDRQMLENHARSELLDLETLRFWERNPMGYAGLPGEAVDGLMKRNFAPPPARLRAVVARLGRVPFVYRAARENLASPPREYTDVALRMARGSVGFLENDVPRWAKEAAQGDADLLARFEKANAAAVAAAREFAEWLEKDLLPRSNGKYEIGEESFRRKMLYDEMVDMPLDVLLAKGEAQLARDHAAFVEMAKQIDSTKSPAEVMASLSLEHPSAEDLVPLVRRSIDDARRFLVEKEIVTIPSEVRPLIEETPPFARSGTFASMDTPGPYETNATEAYYYVTPVEKDWDERHREEHLRLFNRYVTAMVNVHEAYPGHYLQFLYTPRLRTKTRKLLYADSNVEGWAHYAEQMMVDEGFGGGDPKMRLAQLQEALLRDCRYVVGIKLHTQGMTVEDGARIFQEKGFQEPANAYEEARRGSYDPTYLYYTFGKLEVQELRDEYRKRNGATLRQFHDAFVSEGGYPFPLLRKILFRESDAAGG